jgi:hypothetical protein
MCVLPHGFLVFVEVKRPGRIGGLSQQQKKVIKWLESRKQMVWVVNDFEDFRRKLWWQGYGR